MYLTTSCMLLSLLLLLLSFPPQILAFVSPLPVTFAKHKIQQHPYHQNLLSRSVVADSETEEREEQQHKHKRSNLNSSNNKNDYSNDDDDDSWIPTTNGGFLPNLNKILTRGSTSSASTSNGSTIQQVTTLAEYKRVVVDESQDCLVCVRFYAPWCRACKAIAPPFRRLAATYHHQHGVKFVEVPLTQETARIHQGLNIPSLPFAHIYHPTAGLVEERKINRKEFPEFARVLKTYVDGYCPYPRQEKNIQQDDNNNNELPSDLSP